MGVTKNNRAPTPVRETASMDLMIALGAIEGYTHLRKFGRNTEIDTATDPEDVWGGGGLYTGFPTGAADTVDIVSASADDTAAGSGTQTLLIKGLDENLLAHISICRAQYS